MQVLNCCFVFVFRGKGAIDIQYTDICIVYGHYTFLTDAYEVKVNMDIFKYQEKVKLISQFQRFFSFFNGLLEFASLP